MSCDIQHIPSSQVNRFPLSPIEYKYKYLFAHWQVHFKPFLNVARASDKAGRSLGGQALKNPPKPKNHPKPCMEPDSEFNYVCVIPLASLELVLY